MKRLVLPLTLALLAGASPAARALDLAAFEKRVTVKVLANGLTVIVCERPQAPVFSYLTLVDVGGDREVPGITGLAHMFEHMAFKGTDTIGTTDYAAEKAALQRVEAAYEAYDAERRKPVGRDDARLAALQKAWHEAVAAADAFVVKNAFGEIVEREGGLGLNAFTSSETTGYLFSMPVNRLELWAYLESERFLKPVLREFYKERDVVMEERRMRTDSSPFGRLIEQFLAAAFTAHTYGQPVIGWPSDLESFSATDAQAFYDRYYVPANMIVAVVGDVKAAAVLPLIERYFGRLPTRPKADAVRTEEPPQRSERTVVLREAAQPIYMEAYKRPAGTHPDGAVYEVLDDLLTAGRTSRLFRALVRDKKIAAEVGGSSEFPGSKYPTLFWLYAIPTPGHTADELRDAIRAELARIRDEDVSDQELRMVKTRAKANLIRRLDNNHGLAFALAFAQAQFGDWRAFFRRVERVEKVTKQDLRRVAAATFVPSTRTVGILETAQPAAAAKGGQ